LFNEKTRGQKSRDTLPLMRINERINQAVIAHSSTLDRKESNKTGQNKK
jgi:hypothetical protein